MISLLTLNLGINGCKHYSYSKFISLFSSKFPFKMLSLCFYYIISQFLKLLQSKCTAQAYTAKFLTEGISRGLASVWIGADHPVRLVSS